jgi:hypothetical protein
LRASLEEVAAAASGCKSVWAMLVLMDTGRDAGIPRAADPNDDERRR